MGKTPPTSVLEFKTQQSNGEAPVMFETLGDAEYPSLTSLPGILDQEW